MFDEADWMQDRAADGFPQQRSAQLRREVPPFEPETALPAQPRLQFQHTLRNGVVIAAVEQRYDHFVGAGGTSHVDQVRGRGPAGTQAQRDGGEVQLRGVQRVRGHVREERHHLA